MLGGDLVGLDVGVEDQEVDAWYRDVVVLGLTGGLDADYATYALVSHVAVARAWGETSLKGRQGPVSIFELIRLFQLWLWTRLAPTEFATERLLLAESG